MVRTTALTAALLTPIPHWVAPLRRIIALAAVALGLVSAAPAARADIIIGDLPGNDNFVTFISTGSKGIGFTMTDNYLLTSAILRLNASSATVTLRLMDSISGLPTNTLLTFNSPSFGSGVQNYVFIPSTFYPLVTGKSYWLVLTGDTGIVVWAGSSNPAITPTGAGATHLGVLIGSFPPTVPNSEINSFELDGRLSPVPAPPAVVLVGLGAGCVALRRYVQRRASA
jgi:hypothetical protein